MTALCFTDFRHVPRPKKVLFGGSGGKAKQVHQTSAPQTFKAITHLHAQNTVLSREH